MKRLFATTLIVAALLAGCGSQKESVSFDGYSILEQRSATQYLVYDDQTLVMYLLNEDGNGYGYFSICPYYTLDSNNTPVVAVYNGDLPWEEDVE